MIKKIYLDMDGVLCDFIGHARTAKPDLEEWGADEILWPVVLGMENFWENLPWCWGGEKVLKAALSTGVPVEILTSPSTHDIRCYPGKLKWLKDRGINLPVNFEKEKWRYAEPGHLLIDDLDRNCIPFVEHHGVAIHHTSDLPWKTIDALNNYFPLSKGIVDDIAFIHRGDEWVEKLIKSHEILRGMVKC